MRTVSIFRNNSNQAVRIPKDMQYEGVTELEIRRDGDIILLRPARPSWISFAQKPLADPDFMADPPSVVASGRFDLTGVDEETIPESKK